MTRWRAKEIERTTVAGLPMPAVWALVGDRQIIASGTEVVSPLWRHECGAKPNVTTDSLEYDSAWGIERDRVIPTRSAVVRLLSDGELERGHQLRDGQVPAPVVLTDGTIVVLDGEKLLAARSRSR